MPIVTAADAYAAYLQQRRAWEKMPEGRYQTRRLSRDLARRFPVDWEDVWRNYEIRHALYGQGAFG